MVKQNKFSEVGGVHVACKEVGTPPSEEFFYY